MNSPDRQPIEPHHRLHNLAICSLAAMRVGRSTSPSLVARRRSGWSSLAIAALVLQARQWRTAALAALVRLPGRQAAERRQAERALLQTEVFYHSLVETIPQMILCKDLEGRFTFANQKFCAELGTTLEEIKGKTDFDFFPSELAEKYRARRQQGARERAGPRRRRGARHTQGREALRPGHEDAAVRARRQGRSASRGSSGT